MKLRYEMKLRGIWLLSFVLLACAGCREQLPRHGELRPSEIPLLMQIWEPGEGPTNGFFIAGFDDATGKLRVVRAISESEVFDRYSVTPEIPGFAVDKESKFIEIFRNRHGTLRAYYERGIRRSQNFTAHGEQVTRWQSKYAYRALLSNNETTIATSTQVPFDFGVSESVFFITRAGNPLDPLSGFLNVSIWKSGQSSPEVLIPDAEMPLPVRQPDSLYFFRDPPTNSYKNELKPQELFYLDGSSNKQESRGPLDGRCIQGGRISEKWGWGLIRQSDLGPKGYMAIIDLETGVLIRQNLPNSVCVKVLSAV